MQIPKWAQWAIAASILVIVVPIVGTAILGGNQARCVGVDNTGEIVKARGGECDHLSNVVMFEIGENGQVQVSGAQTVEFAP